MDAVNAAHGHLQTMFDGATAEGADNTNAGAGMGEAQRPFAAALASIREAARTTTSADLGPITEAERTRFPASAFRGGCRVCGNGDKYTLAVAEGACPRPSVFNAATRRSRNPAATWNSRR
jgi:hypothetical protein